MVDANGAVIPGASVTAKSVETGVTREATGNAEGFYTVASLQTGLYEVTTQASGFATITQRVQVTVGSSRRLETRMSVTPVTGEETVVGSGGIAANSRNQQLADTISTRQIQELPTIIRDPYRFVSLSGNVTPMAPAAGATDQVGNSYSINGQRPSGNNLQLDGGENIDTLTTSLGQKIPLESVQEIQVITSAFQPEYGRATGGIINVATRQGGNDFHGSLFEFHRNREFSSNSFENNALGIRRGKLVANQFGYAIGGPVSRDKIFFFNSTEANLVRSREDRVALVPTPQLLAASGLGTRNLFNAFPLGTPINGPVFTVGQINNLLGLTTTAGNAFASLPSGTPAFGLVRYSAPVDVGAGLPQDSVSTVGRVDWNLTESSTLYGRYAFEDRAYYRGAFSFSPFAGFDTRSRERNHSALVNLTHTISPAWVSNSKVSFNRVNFIREFGSATPRLFFSNAAAANIGGFALALPGVQPFNPSWSEGFTGPQNVFNAFQDFNTTWRNQQIRFGANYFYTQDNRTLAGLQNSLIILGGGIPQALNNLVLGQASVFQTAINTQGALPGQTITLPVNQPNFNRSISAHDFALYFGHNWRATPRLNVNWGLRYDFFGVPRTRGGRVVSNFYLGQGSDVFTQVRNGQLLTAGNSGADGLYERDYDNIAPRIGFAYDMTGDGRTSLRGGYGISYERVSGSSVFNVFRNWSNFGIVSLTANTGTTGTIPLNVNNFGPLAGTAGTIVLPGTAISAIEEDIRTPYVHFWSLVLERELGGNTLASIQYSGAAGRDLFTVSNVNRPGSAALLPGAAPTTARLNPQFGPIHFLASNGRSNYNAMIAELSNSSWRNIGLTFTARYRYSKALDNISSTLGSGFSGLSGFSANLLDPFNPNFDYGPSDFDVRHRFIGSFSWEVPFDKIAGGGSGIAQQILGGWQLAGIINARSGSPFTIYNCAGAVTAETPCPRAAFSGGVDRDGNDDPSPDPTVPNRFVYLNVAGQVAPVAPGLGFGPFDAGTLGRNSFRGPGNWNLDAALHKRFRITEDANLQFRAELYNALPRSNLFVPGNAIDISSTGYVPAFRSGRRHLQLGLKLLF